MSLFHRDEPCRSERTTRRGIARQHLVIGVAVLGLIAVAALLFHKSTLASGGASGSAVEGVAVSDCAPWDGRATSIFLSSNGDFKRLPPTPPYLHLVVYEAGVRLPGLQVELGRPESGSGLALRCDAKGECATSNRGVIQFEASQTDSFVVGSYHLDFSGDSVSGRFHARWSNRVAICG